jgi:hypothetical protein
VSNAQARGSAQWYIPRLPIRELRDTHEAKANNANDVQNRRRKRLISLGCLFV